MNYVLVCTKCDYRLPADSSEFRCGKCGSVLEVSYDYESLRLDKGFKRQRITHKKYAAFLPVNGRIINMGEGGTKLLRQKKLERSLQGGVRLHLKVETENPTRTFKDRGSSVEISKALELGFDKISCASTGNMGLSLAAYSERHGIDCTVFISKDGNREKIEKIRDRGANVTMVNGDFNRSMKLSEAFATKEQAFMCGDYHYRKEGQKTMAFEIIEQMGYRAPDYIFVQVGNATLLAAMYKGLSEFKGLGLIKKMPKLVAVQSEECDPLVRAYKRRTSVKYMKPRTAADAIAVGYPTFGFEGLIAIKRTDGSAISVSDAEIERCGAVLNRSSGIAAELGGAAGFAGFIEMHRRSPTTFKDKDVVVIVTGNNED